jgi:N-formylglutamate amidohydrolase
MFRKWTPFFTGMDDKEQEIQSIESELTPPFSIVGRTRQTAPFIFNSPHSGRIYPQAFLNASRLSPHALRKSEDAFVDELFTIVPAFGAVLMKAHFPRAYLDVNREPYELDPALFGGGRLPDYANTHSVRVIGGLGTIARVVNEQEEIYRSPLSVDAALERIARLHTPYHQTLTQLIEDTRSRFGCAYLIDCHSMPSHIGDRNGVQHADIILGDRYGKSCSRELSRLAEDILTRQGYRVGLNKPYAGGFITEHYGRPAAGIHALQIEVNRKLYMNEETFEKLPGFETLSDDLRNFAASLISAAPVRRGRDPYGAAAE